MGLASVLHIGTCKASLQKRLRSCTVSMLSWSLSWQPQGLSLLR